MKKFIAWLIAALLILSPVAMAEGNWYAVQGKRLADRLAALVGEQAYMEMLIENPEVLSVVAEVAETDFSVVEEARLISLPSVDTLMDVFKLFGVISNEKLPEMSAEAEKDFIRRMIGVPITAMNNAAGTTWIVATSVLNTFETYIMPRDFNNSILILEYPGDYAVAVTFAETGEQTITAKATLMRSVFNEDMNFVGKMALQMLMPKVELN